MLCSTWNHSTGQFLFFDFASDNFERNLQAALNGWFEYGGAVVLPQARFVLDITIGEGESVPPNNQFTKTWRIGKSTLASHVRATCI